MTDLARIMQVYAGSDAERTRLLYGELAALGVAGALAVDLLRACKASERAKVYRGSSHRDAYAKKQWAMGNVARALIRHAGDLAIAWGWARDPEQPIYQWVLYVELPTGQVSFHTADRGLGPDNPSDWDGKTGQAPERICRWAAQLLETAEAN